MRHHAEGQPVAATADAAGRPVTFVLGGRTHRVETVEDVREPRLEWWSPVGEVHRVYYLVTTDRGWICELYHDVAGGAWYLARVFD